MAQSLQNRGPEAPKSSPERSKTRFFKTSNLSTSKKSVPYEEIAIFSQLGSILEAQDPPKSRPKPEKIDVEKRHIFDIDF